MSLNNLRVAVPQLGRIFSRALQTSATRLGPDAREKRLGHVYKTDQVDGERGIPVASKSSFEYIDENLMDRLFDGIKFKDLPSIFIKCTRNNTKICLVKGDGGVLAVKSAGTEGFKNCRKGTTVAAQAVAQRVVTFAKDHDIDTIRLVFNGLGPGRNASYKVIELSGLKVVSLSDRTEAIEPWIRRPRGAKSI